MHTASFYEKKRHGTMKYPVAYYYVDHTHPQYNMPFHWHTEWELIRVRNGQLVLHVDEEEYFLREGDVILIRNSMFHGGAAAAGVYECLVFDFYGLFHGDPKVEEFLWPFYLMNYLSNMVYTTKANPDICRLVGEIMDVNLENVRKKEGAEGFTEGYCEIVTALGLARVFAEIKKQGLYSEITQETPRSAHKINRIKDVLEYVEKHYQNEITLGMLADIAGMNPQYFCRAFKNVTMQSPMDYVIFYRLEQAARLLTATDMSIMDIAMGCGFNDCSYFIRVFKKQKNVTPNQYRKQRNSV